MPSSHAANPDAINLAHVMRAVLRRLPVLALIAGLVGAATAVILSAMAPQYLSQVQLKIRGSTGTNPGSDAAGLPDKEAVGTHVRGLMSTELALKMSKALDLTRRSEFNAALEPDDVYGRTLRSFGVGGPKPGETDEDRLMQAYFKAVRAYPVRETRAIIVDCTSSNAKFSATCANTLASLYRDSLRGRAVVENSDMRSTLAPEVARLTRETSEAESQAAEFRGKANLFQGSAQATQLKDQQLSELSAELTRAATARGDADARAQAAREMSARGLAAANPDVQKSALIPRMEEQRVTLERQIAELSATLLPGHPRMKQLNSELSGLQSQIRAEVLKVVDSLGNDARIAADREAGVRRRVEELKRTVVSSAPDTARLAQLETQAKAKRTELERVQRQYEAAASSVSAASAPAEVEIVSEAYPSNEKVFPKTGMMSALTAVATLILGFALSLTRELVRGARPATAVAQVPTRERDAPTLEREAPLLATPAPQTVASAATAGAPERAVKRTTPQDVARSLAATAQGTRGFRVLVTNTGTSVAGAQEAASIAQHLGATGARVLLIGWAGSGDSVARVNGCLSHPGTAELLAGTASLEEAIQSLPDRAIDVLPAGQAASVVVDGDSAGMVLDALDELYDYIVVTAAPKIARELFEAIQGRFDAGVLVTFGAEDHTSNHSDTGFLGFEVPDLPVLTVAAEAVAASPLRSPAAHPRARTARTGIGA